MSSKDLTLNNILPALQRVRIAWPQLADVLETEKAVYERIAQESKDDENKGLRLVLRHWLDNDPNASWDVLSKAVMRLSLLKPFGSRLYSEYVTEDLSPSAMCEEVKDIVEGWFELGYMLLSSTENVNTAVSGESEEEKRISVVDYWLKIDTLASWELLAGRIEDCMPQHEKLATEIRHKYVPKVDTFRRPRSPSPALDTELTVKTASEATQGVEDWYAFGWFLKLDKDELKEIEKKSTRNDLRREAVLQAWLEKYPADASWVVLSDALKRMPQHVGKSETIRRKYSQQYYKALEEGEVSVKLSKFSLSGPPGSGKSSVMKLLLNEDPPLQHESTPVATEPEVRHIKTTTITDGSCWESTDSESIKKMLSSVEIKVSKEENQEISSRTTLSDLRSNLKQHLGSADDQHSLPRPLSIDSSEAAGDIVKLATTSQNTSHPRLAEVHLIYGMDSGGQAAFLDISPALMRYNSVNILTHKLDESLDDKPKFIYSVQGEQVGKPIERQITHLQLLEASIRSSASLNLQLTEATVPDSIFLVLGTFYDRLKYSKESLNEKNEKLLSQFEWYLKNRTLKWYKEHCNQIIYPVNTIDRGEETVELAEEIRSAIRDHYVEASVPARWFLFQLELGDYQKKHNTSVVSLSECERIGESIKMDPEDVEAALLYYNDLTIFLYFPDVLPKVVFLHPQLLYNKLSDLISISFAETIEQLPKLRHLLPDNVHRNLKTMGTFNIELLQLSGLKSGFDPDYFTADDFIKLMGSLFVIVSLPDEGEYFLPCVLPTCDSSQLELVKKDFEDECDPLVLTWKEGTIPQGLFPALVVSLLKSEEFELVEEPQHYRNAVQLFGSDLDIKIFLVDAIDRLEVYCTERENCPSVREQILRGISSVSDKFNIKGDPSDSFLGVYKCKTYVCYPNKNKTKMVSKCRKCVVPINKDRQLCWFDHDGTTVTAAGRGQSTGVRPHAEAAKRRTGADEVLDITQLQEVLSSLRAGHFSNVKWHNLGLALGLYEPTLGTIAVNNRGDVEGCLRECLTCWLGKADGVKDKGGPTMTALAVALKEIGEIATADVIGEDLSHHISRVRKYKEDSSDDNELTRPTKRNKQ